MTDLSAKINGNKLEDIVQMLGQRGSTYALVVTGNTSGVIYLRRGEIVGVESGLFRGLDALKVLIRGQGEMVHTESLPDRYQDATPLGGMSSLILESMIDIDHDASEVEEMSTEIQDATDQLARAIPGCYAAFVVDLRSGKAMAQKYNSTAHDPTLLRRVTAQIASMVAGPESRAIAKAILGDRYQPGEPPIKQLFFVSSGGTQHFIRTIKTVAVGVVASPDAMEAFVDAALETALSSISAALP